METTKFKIETFSKVCLRVAILAMVFISCSAFSASANIIKAKWDSGKGTVVRSPAATLYNDSNTSVTSNTVLTFNNTPLTGYYIKEITIEGNSNNTIMNNDGENQITYKWGSTNLSSTWLTFNSDLSVVTINTGSSDFKFEVKFDSPSDKKVYVEWGTTTSWNGDGGSVSSASKTVGNKARVSPDFKSNQMATFTITPATGYVVQSVEIIRGTDLSNTGTWTDITPTGNILTFPMSDRDWCIRIKFVLGSAAINSFVSYYGTGPIDDTAATTPNWIGGKVYRVGGTTDEIGSSAYKIDTYSTNGLKTVRIIPTTSPAYNIVAVKYCEATWNTPSAVTVIGTPTAVTADSNGEFTFTATSPKNYIIFVQFGLIGAVGGQVGAWYGTNNSADYDATTASPSGANGSGGTVTKTLPTPSTVLVNRTANSAILTSDATVTILVHPLANFRISKVQYGDTNPTNIVAIPADPTVDMTFTFPVAGGHSYKVWVVFTSTSASNFTVSGTVDPTTSTLCTPNTITPPTQVISINQQATFTFSTSTNCTIESVNFNSGGAQAWVGSGTSYTTPAITADRSFVVKFKPVGYDIVLTNHASNPSGCGTISDMTTNPTTVNVPRGTSKTFTFNPTLSCSVTHVWVTDANRGYVDKDIAPLASATYTFTDVQAAGSLKVQYSAITPTSADSYCQVPAFVAGQASLAPNVLIIFDNSGSMGGNDNDGFTYLNIKTYDCTSSSTPGTCTSFYGYFDPTKMYKIDPSDSNKYLINPITLDLSSSLSGNKLNFNNMHKVDVIRKVLIGGKVVNRSSSPYFLATDNGKTVEYGTTLPTGLIQNLSGKVRFGLMVFNNPADGGHLATIPVTAADPTGKAVLGSTQAGLLAAIEGTETDPKTSTPISETLYEAIRYFQAKPSAYNTGVDYGTMDPVQNSCQKHFILLLTDGEPNSTDKLPGTANSYTDSIFNATTWENRILTNDRASNTNTTCSSATYGSSTNSEKVEAVAYYMHATDLRSSVYGNAVDTTETVVQNITLFPVYAFGNGSGKKTLMMAAKYGGYDNYDGNAPSPNTYPSPKTPDNPVVGGSPEWDKTGTCIPYNYFEADNGTVLENNLNTAMSSILAKVASGTAASILSNSEGSGANLLQAVFYPNKIFPAPDAAVDSTTEVSWIGEMQNLWYYVDPFIANSTVREDTDFLTTAPNHILHLKNDYAARYYFDTEDSKTKVDLKEDTDGDGLGNGAPINSGVDPDTVKSLWRAGKQLWARAANSRTIHTSINGYSLLPTLVTGKGGFYSPYTVANTAAETATDTRAAALRQYLQASVTDSNSEAIKIINYVRGTDQTGYRNRRVSLKVDTSTVTHEWKLGDIVSSTPKLQSTNKLNSYNLMSPIGYNDGSYDKYIKSSNYMNRGMVYVGANDGMLHAFKLGKLTVASGADTGITSGASTVKIGGFVKASLTGTNLGEEQWAYIPRNALPYLKYYTDSINYKHINYLDGSTVLSDISVLKSAACSSDYSLCPKDVIGGTNWTTVLIGSMGLGGASKLSSNSCSKEADGRCVKTPIFDPDDTAATKTKGVGYSSYFAMDVANQYFNSDGTLAGQPVLKWEFPPRDAPDNFGLGFSTSGAAIVRISPKLPAVDGIIKPDTNANGKWFAVFASGPTGPIDSSVHRFMGRSDQNMKLFVVDLGATVTESSPFVLNTNYWVIDTLIPESFGGSVVGGAIDTDRWNSSLDGNYQDDAVYVGYTKKRTDSVSGEVSWTDGGVGRLLTKESTNPLDWTFSKVIDGIGPVTTGISRLQDRNNRKLWLYFGTGRFFYTGDDSASDASNQRYLMGVQDECYTASNKINPDCSSTALSLSSLRNQTTINSSAFSTSEKGWYVALDSKIVADSLGAERSITDPVAQSNGAVFFTTFKPTTDVCKFGGYSYIWGFNYATGGAASSAALTGKVLVQVSTGAFEEVSLSEALKDKEGRKMGAPMIGKPPTDPPPVISSSNNKPLKKILHIQEK